MCTQDLHTKKLNVILQYQGIQSFGFCFSCTQKFRNKKTVYYLIYMRFIEKYINFYIFICTQKGLRPVLFVFELNFILLNYQPLVYLIVYIHKQKLFFFLSLLIQPLWINNRRIYRNLL